MSAIGMTTSVPAVRRDTVLWRLAATETGRYARHPLFIVGVLLTLLGLQPDPKTSSFYNVIVPGWALVMTERPTGCSSGVGGWALRGRRRC
ncbi:hypothetical protein ACIQFZ_40435 [Streptomyces sp. NPDC093064]|uniref:hypothetical protein n=1 Tax=Streptomyces sp. NPDC093064 TaxID=3366020 RepID=UPI0037FC2FF1